MPRRKKKKSGARRVQLTPVQAVRAGTLRELGGRPGGRWPVVELRDGRTGYGMTVGRGDDCFRAALATVLQVPVEQIPDVRLDKTLRARLAAGHDRAEINHDLWARIATWLAARGQHMVAHDAPPTERECWIGVCVFGARARAMRIGDDHCLVMAGAEVLFDPAITLRPPPGHHLASWDASSVTYGITVDSI